MLCTVRVPHTHTHGDVIAITTPALHVAHHQAPCSVTVVITVKSSRLLYSCSRVLQAAKELEVEEEEEVVGEVGLELCPTVVLTGKSRSNTGLIETKDFCCVCQHFHVSHDI